MQFFNVGNLPLNSYLPTNTVLIATVGISQKPTIAESLKPTTKKSKDDDPETRETKMNSSKLNFNLITIVIRTENTSISTMSQKLMLYSEIDE